MKILDEFKKFISRGNVIDMAVGVVMGTAFTKIINSLVTNIITPVLGVITGKVNIADLSVTISESLIIPYGQFLQAVIDFLLISVAVFLMVKITNVIKDRFTKPEEPAAPEEPMPSNEEILLTEIRDLLKKN